METKKERIQEGESLLSFSRAGSAASLKQKHFIHSLAALFELGGCSRREKGKHGDRQEGEGAKG